MIRNITSHDVIGVLKKKGWAHVGTKGSHWQFKHPTKKGRVTVPHPKKSLGSGTIKSILRQAGLTDEEFEECLKN
ncbi:TPA: type II toxin-antitoxin system HicA family toxin [Legionella pneumophila]|uniref:type II toxin-antitoxin system HicA family toxin n=1 Tax=Legionella pneumophila TaxID=446 RepID=UPI0020BDAFE9|nr:type II toxin-antitoxin system HicA family toxin [Legionella pneumophila]WII13936.1 type II toxin-antitoxin system HicA family toxin [Legionella pneumophila]